MSDGATKRRVTTGRSGTRRKGAPRGGRLGLTRPQTVAPVEDDDILVEFAPVVAPTRGRRATAQRQPLIPALSRDVEIAYIRADMRRLLIIAGGLLALMLVILVFVGR